jgi:hypothetical protein
MKYIKLYHGTSFENATKLAQHGWNPNYGFVGGNMGNPKYLYLTNFIENAQWFAEEQYDKPTIIEINIPIDKLKVDPEDGIGENVQDELNISKKQGTPAYLATPYPISAGNIKIVK